MLPSSKIIKKTAATALRGKMLRTCAAVCPLIFSCLINLLVFEMLAGILGVIAAYLISAAVFLFLVAPLFLGELLYFRRLIWGEDDETVLVFHYFSQAPLYKGAMRLILKLFVRTILPAVVFLFPAFVAELLASNRFYLTFNSSMPVWAANLNVVSLVLRTIGFVAVFFTVIKYFLAPFLFVSAEGTDSNGAIEKSVLLMKNITGDFLLFVLSFFGWFLLSVLVVPLLVVAPYFLTSFCVFCRFTVAQYNKTVNLQSSPVQNEVRF